MARLVLFPLVALALLGACATDAAEDPAAAPAEPDMEDPDRGFPGELVLGTGHERATGVPPAPAPDEDLDDAGPHQVAQLPPLEAAQAGDRIVKEGTISVEVEAGAFDRAFAAVIDAAGRLGGTVVSSTTRTGEDDRTSGTITVRVPVEDYERLLVSVGDIGKVRERHITAEDVSAEFVDLQSRLRHLHVQERFYLELMEEAGSVSDAIAVQQHLQDIQQQTEQIRGRLQYLEARTAHSVLTVELLEPGTQIAGVLPASTDRPSLGLYWERARDAFVNTVGGLLVAALFLAPLVLPAGFLVLGWRALRRRSPLQVD